MENLRGNSSNYDVVEDNSVTWVVIFAILVAVILWISYVCKKRWTPIVIFEYTTRPGIEMGSSTSINVDPRPLMLQVSSPRKRSSSPKDPAEMV
jgi:hypothetical protein